MVNLSISEKEIIDDMVMWMRGWRMPREVGLNRKKVATLGQLLVYLTDGNGDKYMSVFSLKQVENEEYDTIFIDIDVDGGSIEKGYNVMRDVVSKLANIGIGVSRVYFSGRGWHVYVDIEPIMGKEKYKKVCKAIVREAGISRYVDSAVIGDVRRMARIPHSINMKSGIKMVQVNPYEDLSIMKEKIMRGEMTRWVGKVYNVNEYVDKDVVDVEDNSSDMEAKRVFNSIVEYPPCIREGIRLLVETGELDHYERMQVALFLIWNGEEEKLWKYLKYAGDYNESISKYQVEYLKKRKLKMYKCDNVSSQICVYGENKAACPYYPTLNRFFVKRGDSNE